MHTLTGHAGCLTREGPVNAAYRAREGGREHDSLARRPDIPVDATDLGLESHVKHPISLVKDQICDTPQVGDLAGAGDQDVNHASRCAHHDFCASLQLCDLVCDA